MALHYVKRSRNRKVSFSHKGYSLRDLVGKGVYYKRSGGLIS